MRNTTIKHRALAVLLSAAMLLQFIVPMAAPAAPAQTSSATTPTAIAPEAAPKAKAAITSSGGISPQAGKPNTNGTYLETWVGTEQLSTQQGIAAPPTGMVEANLLPTYDNASGTFLGDFASQPGAITKQRIRNVANSAPAIVYLTTIVHWGSGEQATPTTAPVLTFNKPAGATFNLSADSSTTNYVASVSQTTAGTTVTITLKTGIPYDNLFNISYYYSYNATTPDKLTTDVTPTLTLPSGSVTGDPLSITTACAIDLYPAMGINTAVLKFNGSNGAVPAQADLQPAATNVARVGSAYTYQPKIGLLSSLLNQPTVTGTPQANATFPKTATYALTLPPEAVVVGSLPAGWTQTTNASGQIVLLNSTWDASPLLTASYTLAGYYPGPTLAPTISYTAPPANGTAYVYSATVTGTWQDGSPFSFTTPEIDHVYTAIAPSLNFSLGLNQTVSSFMGGGLNNDGMVDLTYATKYLSLGDQENFTYSINNNLGGANPSEVPLSDLTVTIPFDGSMWDLDHFWGVTPDRFDTMKVTYSDGSTATFSVSDLAKFDTVAGAAVPVGSGLTMTASDPLSWLMAGKPAGVSITQFDFHTAPGFTVPVGAAGQRLLALMVTLRSTRVGSGAPIVGVPDGGSDVGKTSASVTVSAPAGMTTNPPTRTMLGASASVPIYATQEERPVEWGSWNLNATYSGSITGIPASVAPGQSFPISATQGWYVPQIDWNEHLPQPTAVLKLPANMVFDAANAQLIVDAGAQKGLSMVPNAPAPRVLSASDYTVSVSTPGDGYSYYSFTYTGAADPNDANTGVLTYNGDYGLTIKGTVSIPDDATAASNVPLTEYATSPAIATNSPATTVTTNIVVPTILSANEATQGDVDPSYPIGGTAWKKDTGGGTATPFSDLNLATVKAAGVLRHQVINNTANPTSGDLYVAAPTGSFTPILSALPLAQTVNAAVNGGAPVSTTGTWYYTTAAAPTDLTTVTSWIPITASTPVSSLAGATAFKFAGVTVAPGDRVNLVFDYDIPAAAAENQTARSYAQVDTTGLVLPHTNYAGFRVSKPAYRVDYYRDSVSAANLLGSSPAIRMTNDATPTELVPDDLVTLASGTTLSAGQLDALRPPGYITTGVQQGAVPYTMLDATDKIHEILPGDAAGTASGGVNIINVLYMPRTDYSVNYDLNGGSYDSTTTVPAQTGLKFAATDLLPQGAAYDETKLAKPGYTFAGWKVVAGGSGSAMPSSVYSGLATDENSTTLTLQAQWTPAVSGVTINYHTFTADGTTIATEHVEAALGETIDPVIWLDTHRPVGFGSGVAVAMDTWTVTADGMVFDVYYPDTPPVINVERPVIYVRQPVKLTVADILRIAGVSVTDAEETIPLSKLTASGYDGIKWSVVNYPDGDGYTITLSVADTPGLEAPVKQIAIFVESASTPVIPNHDPDLPPAPPGMEWGTDPEGDPILYIPVAPPALVLPKTGDQAFAYSISLLMVLGVATGVTLSLRRRRLTS